MNETRICGTPERPAVKIVPIGSPKVFTEGGKVYLQGYANTKGHADRYGDVPAVFQEKRGHVYGFSQFSKNPVLLIDHVNRVDHIAGSVTELKEDDKGLFFRAEFADSDLPTVSHARKIYAQGHARGISIAGRFHYENPQNQRQLTLAEIFEISLVAVPADPDALAAAMEKAIRLLGDRNAEEQTKASYLHEVKSAVDRWLDDLKKQERGNRSAA